MTAHAPFTLKMKRTSLIHSLLQLTNILVAIGQRITVLIKHALFFKRIPNTAVVDTCSVPVPTFIVQLIIVTVFSR
jgi:hypothetical protein